jgi:hypothetical protein
MGMMRQRLCNQLCAPPWRAKGQAFGFLLQGDGDAIEANVTRPAFGDDYKPASILFNKGLFALTWAHYDEFGGDNGSPNQHTGVFEYKESALVNIVEAGGVKHIYMPSLYLDASVPVVSGREAYGYPKAFGEITMSKTTPGSDVMFLTRADEVQSFLGNPPATRSDIYSARPIVANGATFVTIANPNPHDVSLFAQMLHTKLAVSLAGWPLVGELVEMVKMLVLRSAPMVMLKQIPLASATSQAAYQAYVTADARFTKINSVSLIFGYEVELNDWASAPIASAYGFGGPRTVPALVGFHVDVEEARFTTIQETVI